MPQPKQRDSTAAKPGRKPLHGQAMTGAERVRAHRAHKAALRQAVRDRAAALLDDQRLTLFYAPAAHAAKSASDEKVIAEEIAAVLHQIRTGGRTS